MGAAADAVGAVMTQRPGRVRRAEHRVRARATRARASRRARWSPSRSSSPTRSTGDGTSAFPRLVIDAGPDSEVTVVERFTSAGDVRGASSPRCSSSAAQAAARVRYLAVNELGHAGVADRQPGGGRRAGLHDAAGRRGARRRLRPGADRERARRPGRQRPPDRGVLRRRPTRCTTSAPSRPTSRRGPRATSCSRARSRAGRGASTPASSRSGHEARGANAFQTNRNLKLSEEAWAESVPNLDIKTNDVRCSHASTVGPVDEEQRFYLESRGVPPDDRRAADRARLLRRGARPAPGARRSCPALRRQVMAKLDRRDVDDRAVRPGRGCTVTYG